jgi:hypothetical protein
MELHLHSNIRHYGVYTDNFTFTYSVWCYYRRLLNFVAVNRAHRDLTFIVLVLAILSDTQLEDLERPQNAWHKCLSHSCIKLLRLRHNASNYPFHLRIAMEINKKGTEIFRVSSLLTESFGTDK